MNADRPSYRIEMDGIDTSKLGLKIERVTVDLNLITFGGFSVVFSGNGPVPDGFDWMTNDLFALDKKVSIRMGNSPARMTTMISGRISDISAVFPSSGTPSIEISGDDSEDFLTGKKRRQPTLIKKYGKELLSFNPEVSRDPQMIEDVAEALASKGIGSLSASKHQRHLLARYVLEDIQESPIVAVGECVGDPDVVPGRALKLEGLGDWFSRTYSVNGAVQTFDLSGYRTTFMVTTR
jgi:hypothetical protein